MADNTTNDDEPRKAAPAKAAPRREARKDAAPRAARKPAAPKAAPKPAPKRPAAKREKSRFDVADVNRNWLLGGAAVLSAALAGGIYAAWRQHADGFSLSNLFGGDDDDTIEPGDANVEGATYATAGSTPDTKVKEARDVMPTGEAREAFAPATVPVRATETTSSSATA